MIGSTAKAKNLNKLIVITYYSQKPCRGRFECFKQEHMILHCTSFRLQCKPSPCRVLTIRPWMGNLRYMLLNIQPRLGPLILIQNGKEKINCKHTIAGCWSRCGRGLGGCETSGYALAFVPDVFYIVSLISTFVILLFVIDIFALVCFVLYCFFSN